MLSLVAQVVKTLREKPISFWLERWESGLCIEVFFSECRGSELTSELYTGRKNEGIAICLRNEPQSNDKDMRTQKGRFKALSGSTMTCE